MWSLMEAFHGEREKCFLGGSLENGHLMEGVPLRGGKCS